MLDIERPWWHPPLPEYPGAAVLALPRDDYQSPQRVSVEPGMVRLHFGRLTLPVERPTVVWSTGPDLRVEGRETSRVLRTGLPESELARVANVLDRVRDLQPGQRPFFRVVPSFDALATIDPDALFDPELVAPWGEASVDALHLLLPATDGRHYLRLRHQDVGWRLGGRLVHFPVHKVVAVRQRGFRLDIQLEGGAGVSWHLALPPARVYRLVHAIRAFLARNRAGGIDSPPHHLLQLRAPMISLLLATALAEPDVEVSVGGGIFAPARRAWNVSPTLDGQVDVGGLVPEAPMLLATANAELGFYAIYGCEQCNLLGRWALGVGPTVTTEWVDVTLLGRLRGLGNNVNIRPALQATGRVQAGDLALRPYFQVDGVRYVDMEAGLRVVVGGSDGTRTRAQQCEEGTLRELEGPVVAGSVTGIAPFGTEAVKVDFGDVYANPLVNALGQIKDTVGEYLAALGIYQSSKALGAGEAGLSDFAGRAQDIAGKNGWDWAIPLSAADLPGALATIELEIGKRAIDALIPHLEAYREQFAFGIDVAYHKRTTSFECVPVQVCEDGWWKDAGWTQRGESVVTDGRVITKRFRAPEGNTPQGRTARMWRMIGQWYRSMNPAGPEYVKRLEDPCGVADVFHTDVEVESGPEQESCEGWLKERAALQSERRALVGSWLDLHTEQLEWASGQAKQDCEDARASAAANARSAEVQAEIAGIAGDATSRGYAADLATRAEEARAHADALCGWAGKVDQRLGESKADVEGRPGRLEAIDAELAALEERIATCDLVE